MTQDDISPPPASIDEPQIKILVFTALDGWVSDEMLNDTDPEQLAFLLCEQYGDGHPFLRIPACDITELCGDSLADRVPSAGRSQVPGERKRHTGLALKPIRKD